MAETAYLAPWVVARSRPSGRLFPEARFVFYQEGSEPFHHFRLGLLFDPLSDDALEAILEAKGPHARRAFLQVPSDASFLQPADLAVQVEIDVGYRVFAVVFTHLLLPALR
jgi:hypothetical protein